MKTVVLCKRREQGHVTAHLAKRTSASGRLWWMVARWRAKEVESLRCALKQSSRFSVVLASSSEKRNASLICDATDAKMEVYDCHVVL